MPKTREVLELEGPTCCPPVARGVIGDDNALEVAARLKALADPVRLKIVSILLSSGTSGSRNVDLAAQLLLSDATLSHHLGQLSRAGLLKNERKGTSIFYRVDCEALFSVARVIDPYCC